MADDREEQAHDRAKREEQAQVLGRGDPTLGVGQALGAGPGSPLRPVTNSNGLTASGWSRRRAGSATLPASR
ncbi:MAG: hypothetical protein ACTS8Z_04740, partial [Candidatus Limnocylindrales bacterium]